MDVTTEDGEHYRLPLKFPMELQVPDEFDPDDLSTWPRVDGRLEWVGGRLLFMPPCGETQAAVVANLTLQIAAWGRTHPEFWVGSNEAGMSLGEDRRAADVGVWKRPARALRPSLSDTPPVLAVEVEGRYDGESALREKARWYFKHGTKIVWLVLPSRREIVVILSRGEHRHGPGAMIPEHPELPGLQIPVDEVFFGL